MRMAVIVSALIVAVVAAAASVLGDVLFGATLYPWFTALVLALGLGMVWMGWRRVRSVALVLSGAVLGFGIVLLRFSNLNPVKPFRSFYLDLDHGMTEIAVISSLDQRFPEAGRFARPSVGRLNSGTLTFTLDLSDPSYDSEIIQVVFLDGRLHEALYLID